MSTNKNKIVKACFNLFIKYGIKSVSVDDISCSLGISKKTFYQYYKNKDSVIEDVANEFINNNSFANREILKEEIDVIDKILKIYKHILEQFHNCNPVFMYDIEKYYSDIYKLFTDFREEELHYVIINLLKQGKNEGIFRSNLDEEMIFDLHMKRMNLIIRKILFPEMNSDITVFFNTMVISLIGISTIKGHELIQEKTNEIK
jgi:AcrR family transcriptional regulator